jgi:ribosome-associated heat shock protein Hsp15
VSDTARLRLDKWLWFARFFKSRTLAATQCTASRVRVNRVVVRKAHHMVKAGDVLTFAQSSYIRVVEIALLGARRGPAVEAQGLYRDLAPRARPVRQAPAPGERDRGAGRPTKAERRAIDRLRGG